MQTAIKCPSCGEIISSKSRHCSKCGVDLAVAALLAEQHALSPIHLQTYQITPEILVPRIGDYLVEAGLLNPEDLNIALAHQALQAENGNPILLGQALLELEMIDRGTLDMAVTSQILELQKALKNMNDTLQLQVEERTAELRMAMKRLSEINELKSNFIANISHELRTPLTHIKGYLDLLDDSTFGEMNPDQHDALQVLKKSESRLENLIEDLIEFSAATKGEISLARRPINMEPLIQTILEHSTPKANKKQINLVAQVPKDSAQVFADKDKISWVLMQFVDNAIKFSPSESQVIVRATQSTGNFISISVDDEGIGIPEDRIQEIFEPFHQLDNSAARKYSGTGLGLAMAKQIVEAHGSQIKVQSLIGHGSHFEFDLPLMEH